MVRRAFVVILLGAVTVLAAVAPAHGSDTVYVVTGTADVLGTCAAMPNVPNAFTCDSLRTAVAAADLNAGDDAIVLQNAGTYPLTRGVVNLTTGVTIYGQGPRSTTIQGNGKDRVFSVAPDVSVDLAAVTISGGVVVGDGGNVLNAGDLSLTWVHVTNGRATNGGGLANQATGTLTVLETLIDANQVSAASGGSQGGGIFNRGTLEVDDSTIFNNTAGSVGAIASASGSVSLSHATIAQNSSTAGTGGISIVGSWVSFGSILVNNRGDGGLSNCGSAAGPGSYGNLEDGQTCGALTSGAIGLATTLSNQGGPTDVLTIPATGPAKGFVTPCASGIDQRYAPRPAAGGRCDAGAFEQGATPQPIPAFPIPTPTPSPTPVPTATPTATPTPTPTPVAGKTVVAKVVKGTVRVRRPGTNTFVELDGTQGIPVGATLDTKHGTVQLTSLQTAGGRPQTASFFDGIFKLTQKKKTTDLTLTEQLAACPKGKKARKTAAAAKKKPKSRRLWGDGSGAFRTRGQYSAATVRGTKWLVQDSCKGTLTRVARGAVTVRDRIRRKTILLRAGRSYLAKPRR